MDKLQLVFDDTQHVVLNHRLGVDVHFARVDTAETLMATWTSAQLQRFGVTNADVYASTLLVQDNLNINAELRIGINGTHVTFTQRGLSEPMTFISMVTQNLHNGQNVLRYPAWLCAFSDAEQVMNAVSESWTTRQQWLFATQMLSRNKKL